ncbi:hypothetical protein TRFO_29717 [Tritrichomonas foetus]|uniref:Condensin II complex subunit H2 N-terminal domain-containing protein n=1 Tax=Tritrichomonas foetus TaxID=1144522 RepID=A0A1J4JWC2_9EUKA|nr:hypothetical protein TRFO_29717 [Tritrichomonas foetus]|eukprot:OHT03010.1 hypothetical protein TRFO_29717 [Tritrichomonas foetus]
MYKNSSLLSEQGQLIEIDKLRDLLKHSRDSSQTWEIPLFDILDTFQNALISFESEEKDPKDIDFPKAGLLIQGSTNIWKKKNDHLYRQVLDSTFFDEKSKSETEEALKLKIKRKKKPSDYIKDGQLIEIDDPLPLEKYETIENKDPLEKISTLPNLPLCLRSSFDISLYSNENGLNSIHDDSLRVILMDKSMNSRNVRHATFHKYLVINEYFLEEEDDKDQSKNQNNEAQYDETECNKKHNNEKQKNVTQAVNSDIHDKNDETQSRNDELLYFEKQIDESLNSNIHNNSILLNTRENKKEIGRENEFETLSLPDYESDDNESNNYDFRFLDPDDINMNKYNKRFQKMIKFNIPTTFSDKNKSENKVNSSFHISLFQDLYLQINTYRKKKEISDDVIN